MTNPTTTCRSCRAKLPDPFLDLGETPLANGLLDDAQLGCDEPRYPLAVAACPRCSLVQLTTEVPPEQLFGEYFYLSSFSETMLRHAAQLVAKIVEQEPLGEDSLVVEIASNDGYLLKNYRAAGIPILGVEPARNIAQVAEENGIPTRCEFFSQALAMELAAAGRADVIHAHNVLAHVPDLNGFVAGIARLLKPQGVAVLEAPYLKELLDHVEFDTIYHEHLCYFSLTALDHLFTRHGLQVTDVARVPIHGGSLRLFVRHAAAARNCTTPNVWDLLAEEGAWGVSEPATYAVFRDRVQQLRQRLVNLLAELKSQGKRIAGYGASAKGTTLLSYTGVGPETLEFIVDRSTVKQGRYAPGTHLRILSPEQLQSDPPDYLLLLTWNFAEEILRQQQSYRDAGGRFIIPIPELKVA